MRQGSSIDPSLGTVGAVVKKYEGCSAKHNEVIRECREDGRRAFLHQDKDFGLEFPEP